MLKIMIGILIICATAFFVSLFTLIKAFQNEDADKKQKAVSGFIITLPVAFLDLICIVINIIFY